jgi:hypothetical protein
MSLEDLLSPIVPAAAPGHVVLPGHSTPCPEPACSACENAFTGTATDNRWCLWLVCAPCRAAYRFGQSDGWTAVALMAGAENEIARPVSAILEELRPLHFLRYTAAGAAAMAALKPIKRVAISLWFTPTERQAIRTMCEARAEELHRKHGVRGKVSARAFLCWLVEREAQARGLLPVPPAPPEIEARQ